MDHNYSTSDIQKYLLNELNETERSQFEQAMNQNIDLAQEVQIQTKIAEGIEYAGGQDFKERTKKIYQEIKSDNNSKSNIPAPRNHTLTILGIISVVVISLFLLYNYFTSEPVIEEPKIEELKNTPDRIYASNFQTYDWNPNQRNDVNDEQLSKAFSFYSSKSFAAAIPLLEKIVLENNQNIPAMLALANSYMESGNSERSLPVLKQILSLDDMLFQDQANWYLALANLKLGEEEEAIRVLKILTSDDKADHYEAAVGVLEALGE